MLDKRKKEAGPESLPVSGSLTNLAAVTLRQGDYTEAADLFSQAKEISAKSPATD